MAALPSGTVTFLFTDIESSTTRWEHQPEAMRVALARHDVLVRAAIVEHDGHVVKTMGDAFHAVFRRAPDAVAAALDAQRRLQAEPWGEIGSIRVRMALHTGAAEERDGDYYGPSLNRAARILGTGHGGQVLLSQATYELIRDDAPTGTTVIDLGEHRLKDLIRPERIFQLSDPGLVTDFPPLRTLDRHPNNLPIQSTPLIGRDREIAAVSALLNRDNVRLVTLTGPGGIGKTRLGLQVAAEHVGRFGDGVYAVELAPISAPSLVASRIAQVLGLADTSGRPLVDLLVERLRDRRILLVLDNFEQVLDAARVVDDLLQRCPALSILVTSRAPLQLRSEHEYPVPPLALPDVGQPVTPEALSQYEAVELFVERATAIRPDFAVTNANASAVAAICARLDGLPLAIELAAARIRLLAPEALLVRLGHSLNLLTGGRRDLPARQQTLRSAIAWSYDLLGPPEQCLYRRLGVFVGGFTLEAAEAVCDQDGGMGIDVLDGIGALVDASLVRQDQMIADEPRFTMLETIREYALELLGASGEATITRQRHRDWFLAFSEHVAAELRGPRDAELLDRQGVEHGNLRAALDWCESEADGIESAARIVEALAWFWVLRGHAREARARVERLAATDSGSDLARARLTCVAGYLAYFRGDHAEARRWEERSLVLWRKLGDSRGVATALLYLAQAVWASGDLARAATLLEEGADLVRRAGAGAPHATVLATYAESPVLNLARLAEQQGDLGRARELLEETLADAQARGYSHGIANGKRALALLACKQGDVDQATTLFKEALRLYHGLADVPCSWNSFILLAYAATLGGSCAHGAHLLGAADIQQSASGMLPLMPVRAVHDDTIAAARSGLGDDAYAAAWAEGRSMTLEQAVAYALDDAPGA